MPRASRSRRRAGKRPGVAFPGKATLRRLYGTLMADPNVVGCFIGYKRTSNRRLNRAVLVCGLKKKRPKAAVPFKKLLPKRIPWRRTAGKTISIETDVQTVGRSSRRQFEAVVGPGDQVTSPEKATIGAVLNHPVHGRVITTAGHVFVKAGYGSLDFTAAPRPMSIANVVGGLAAPGFHGQALKAVVSPDTDYTLIKPSEGSGNQFEDEAAFALTGVHFADQSDLGTSLFVLTCRGLLGTELLGVNGAMDVGKLFAQGLLMTREVTIPGDSGSCLVDSTFRLWGFLIGTAKFNGVRYSVFISPDWVLAFEDATLA